MRPSPGRIVHYAPDTRIVQLPGRCQAALVTAVYPDGRVALAVFGTDQLAFASQGVAQDEDRHAPGTWHWPEREPA